MLLHRDQKAKAVDRRSICNDFSCFGAQVGIEDRLERVLFGILDGLQVDPAAALAHPQDFHLVGKAGLDSGSGQPSADRGFIDLSSAAQRDVAFLHRLADAVAQIPGGFVGASDMPLDLLGGDAFLGFHHEGNRHKPLLQGQVGVVKQRSGGRAEMQTALGTLEQLRLEIGI
jgi:hypothetical protein